ncbi:MAG: hypothetical protein ACJAZO_001635 [Myxococcota bacterium]
MRDGTIQLKKSADDSQQDPLQAKSTASEPLQDSLSDTLSAGQASVDAGSIGLGFASPIQAKGNGSGFSEPVQAKAEEKVEAVEETAQAADLTPDVMEAPSTPGGGDPPSAPSSSPTPSGGPSSPAGDNGGVGSFSKVPGQADGDVNQGVQLPASGGRPLGAKSRARFEATFGEDFSGVRIHETSAVAKMGARAFTRGSQIYFAPGQYTPGSSAGDKLLGHELTHVIQQKGGRVKATTSVDGMAVNDNAGLESEADSMGAMAASGMSVSVRGGSGGKGAGQMKADGATAQFDGGTSEDRTIRSAVAETTGKIRTWSLAAHKWEQILHDSTRYPKVKAALPAFEALANSLLEKKPPAKGEGGPGSKWDPITAMRDAFWKDKNAVMLLGDQIDLADVVGEQGMTRTMDMPSVYNYNTSDDDRYKRRTEIMAGTWPHQGTPDAIALGFAWGANKLPGYFDPARDLNKASAITGGSGVGWWSSVEQTQAKLGGSVEALSCDALMTALAITDAKFKYGATRVFFKPDATKYKKEPLHKPTAFDGLIQGGNSDPMWASATSSFGLTKSGSGLKEALAAPVPVTSLTKTQYVEGTVPDTWNWKTGATSGETLDTTADHSTTKTKGPGPDDDYQVWMKAGIPDHYMDALQSVKDVAAKDGESAAFRHFWSTLTTNCSYPGSQEVEGAEQWTLFKNHHKEMSFKVNQEEYQGAEVMKVKVFTDAFPAKVDETGLTAPAKVRGHVSVARLKKGGKTPAPFSDNDKKQVTQLSDISAWNAGAKLGKNDGMAALRGTEFLRNQFSDDIQAPLDQGWEAEPDTVLLMGGPANAMDLLAADDAKKETEAPTLKPGSATVDSVVDDAETDPSALDVAPGAAAPIEFHSKPFKVRNQDFPEDKKNRDMIVKGTALLRNATSTDLTEEEILKVRSTVSRRWTTVMTAKVAQLGTAGAMEDVERAQAVVMALAGVELSKTGLQLLKITPTILVGKSTVSSLEAAKTSDLLVDQKKRKSKIPDVQFTGEKTKNGEKVTATIEHVAIGNVTLKNITGTVEWKREKLDNFVGAGKAIVAYQDAHVFELDLTNVTIAGGRLTDGAGTFTVPQEIPLGSKDDYKWRLAEGSNGTVVMKKGEIDQIGGGATLLVDDAVGPLMSVDVKGSVPLGENPKPSKYSFDASANLARDVEVASEVGPKEDWSVALSKQSGIDLSIKSGALESIGGTVGIAISDTKEPFFGVTASGTVYEHGKKPKLTVQEATANTLREVHMVTAGTNELWLEPGAGAKVSIKKSEITSISGVIPMRIQDPEGPLVGVKLDGKFEDNEFGGSGAAELRRDIPLATGQGPDTSWNVAARAKKTSLTAAFDANKLTTVTGQLSVFVADGKEEWLDVTGTGTYDHATTSVTKATGSIDVSKSTVVGRMDSSAGPVAASIKKGSAASATYANSKLTDVTGKTIAFGLAVGGKDRLSGAVDGSWTSATGAINGTGSLAVDNDWLIPIGGGSLTVKKGTAGSGEVVTNDLKSITATKIDVDVAVGGDRPFSVNVNGTGTYDHANTNVVDATGAFTLNSPIKLNDKVTLTTLKGGGSVKNNELASLNGELGVSISDDQGAFLKGSITGATWDKESGEASGTAAVKLQRAIDIDVGSDMYITVAKDSGGTGVYTAGALASITGKVKATLFRDKKALGAIDISGTYDVYGNNLIALTATVKILQDFKFMNDKVTLNGISASMTWANNKLTSASGTASMVAPDLMVPKAEVKFGWRNDGTRDYYTFDATFLWVFFKEKAKDGGERSLKGKLAVKYAENDTFVATAAATYKMGEGFEASAAVEIDNTLDPIVRTMDIAATVPMMDAMTMFDIEKNLFNFQLRFLVFALNLGIDIGAKLETLPLNLKGNFGVKDWRPSEGEVPNFTADLSMPWGLTFTAFVGAYIEGAIDVFVASAGIGATARLVLEVPVAITPSVHMFGGPQGYGGTFGIDLSIKPSLILQIIPYLFAELIFFDELRYEMADWKFPLAEFEGLDWSDEFPFGDVKPPGAPKKAPKAITSGTEKENKQEDTSGPKEMGSLKSGSAGAAKNETGSGKLPGGGEMSGAGMMGSETSDGGGTKKDTESKLQKFEKVFDGLKAIDVFMDFMGAAIDYLMMGPIGIVMLAWDVLAGDLDFGELKKAWNDIGEAMVVIGDFIGEGEPSWGSKKRLGDWLAGRITTTQLIMEDDDDVRKAVRDGMHKKPEMTADGLRGMMKVLTAASNVAGDEDEDAILEIAREAKKRGCLNYVVSVADGSMYGGSAQVLYKLDGKQDEKYRNLRAGTVTEGNEAVAAIPEKLNWRKKKGGAYPSIVCKWATGLANSEGMPVLEEYDRWDFPGDSKRSDKDKALKSAVRIAEKAAQGSMHYIQASLKAKGLSWPKK